MSVIKTLIIGLGNIGAVYDINEGSSDTVRSHLRAVLENKDFEIVALIEHDKSKWQEVQNHYGLSDALFFTSVEELPKDVEIHLAVFAVPPQGRLDDLSKLQKHGIRFCVFEKPLAGSLKEAQGIEDFCNQNSIQTIVNFHRRYDVNLQNFKTKVLEEGVPSKVVIHYTKGIKNYGSHAIDLLIDYFGGVKAVQAMSSNNAADPLIDGMLYFENGAQAHLIGHETDYDLFEFEFFYPNKKFTLARGTTQQLVQHAQENLIYENYAHLSDAEEISGAQKVSGMVKLYDDISCFFKNEKHILKGCDLECAKKGVEIIETLLKSASDKRFIQI